MKKLSLVALILTLCLSINASASSVTQLPTTTLGPISNSIATAFTPVGDILTEPALRDISPPSQFWNLDRSGVYEGSFYGLLAGTYTKYFFQPTDEGTLYVKVSATPYQQAPNNCQFKVQCYDQLTGKSVTEFTSSTFSDPNYTHSESRVFLNLDANRFYYFRIASISGHKINGNIWIDLDWPI